MLVASKVKMRGSEKIKANMNRGNKIFESTYDNSSFLHVEHKFAS